MVNTESLIDGVVVGLGGCWLEDDAVMVTSAEV